jgi:hypothetical protein
VVTDQRVLFLWRRWLCGMSLTSIEESFYLDDLQVCCQKRLRWMAHILTAPHVQLSIGGQWHGTVVVPVLYEGYTPHQVQQ